MLVSKFKISSSFIAIVLMLVGVHTALAKAPLWPQEQSDIAVDPAVHFGRLENGLRYAILPNAEPPGRVSLRLHVSAGSLDEAEDQRGLAHFMEHMVFNGSRNFPDVEALIPQMQRLGIAFGAHANAYTSFDETVYMLDLPNTDADTLDLTFTVMRDFADGALLKPEEIEKERGVVLAELKSRDSVGMRLMEQRLAFLMPDFLASERLPIGLQSVIETAPPERFIEFYKTHYIPSNMAFVVVGDIAPEAIETRIREIFRSMKNPDTPYQEPDLGTLPAGFGFRAGVFTDKEVSSDNLSLNVLEPYKNEPDTVETRLKYFPIWIANDILSRRLQILAKEEDAPIKGGSASQSIWLNAIQSHSNSVSPEADKWPKAVGILEQELRRALEHGFTQAEVDEIKANWLNSYEEAVKSAPTRKSPALASGLVESIHSDYVFDHPEESLRIYKLAEPLVTPESTHAALKKAWSDTDLSLILTTNSASADTAQQLETLFKDSQLAAVAPPLEIVDAKFAYTDFGASGSVAERTEVEDLDFVQLKLSNNIRVNLKTTDFQKNSIIMQARFGSGTLSQPKDKTGLDKLASAYLNAGGLGAHSNDELRRILAGKNVGASFSISGDTFILSGSTTPDDLELQLQLMVASLTDPGYRDEALRQFHKQLPALASQLKHTLAGPSAEMTQWLYGQDGRFAKVDPETLATYTADDVRDWVGPDMKHTYLELSLVGDFDIETVIPKVLATFGTLSKRAETKPILDAARVITLPDFPAEKTFTYNSKIDKAVAIALWQTDPMGDNVSEARRMNILASITRDRLRKEIREELGSSYSPSASYSANQAFEVANFSVSSMATKETAPQLQTAMCTIAENIAAEGLSEDELQRALKPVLTELDLSLRQNGHWLSTILGRSQEKPITLEWARSRDADYRAITLEELEALASKYLQAGQAASISFLPEVPQP